MSSDITEIRHGISDTSSSSSSSSSRPASSRVFTPAPAPPQKQKSVPNLKKSKDDIPRDHRAELFAKINQYLTSKKLGPYISEGIRAPSEGASIEVLEAIYRQILESIRSNYKRVMVDTFFEQGMEGMEAAIVNLLHLENGVGLAAAALDQKEELFGLELEEIAIELDPSWVPGPKARLGIKIMRFINEFVRNPPLRNSKTPNNSPDEH